jgi:NTP pyrophosphatase (non-canonical NTP hydrolase)
MSYADVEMKVLQWSEARKIVPNSTAVAQSKKTLEEAGELLEAAAKLKLLSELATELPTEVYEKAHAYIMDELRDAVGDVAVTLINVCALADVDLTTCLEGAYAQIKNRRGTMNDKGIFVKES